jgi:hypothetical protein
MDDDRIKQLYKYDIVMYNFTISMHMLLNYMRNDFRSLIFTLDMYVLKSYITSRNPGELLQNYQYQFLITSKDIYLRYSTRYFLFTLRATQPCVPTLFISRIDLKSCQSQPI